MVWGWGKGEGEDVDLWVTPQILFFVGEWRNFSFFELVINPDKPWLTYQGNTHLTKKIQNVTCANKPLREKARMNVILHRNTLT